MLSVSSLKGKIKAKLQAKFGATPAVPQYLDDYAEALAEAIYEEFTQNAEVNPVGNGGNQMKDGMNNNVTGLGKIQ